LRKNKSEKTKNEGKEKQQQKQCIHLFIHSFRWNHHEKKKKRTNESTKIYWHLSFLLSFRRLLILLRLYDFIQVREKQRFIERSERQKERRKKRKDKDIHIR